MHSKQNNTKKSTITSLLFWDGFWRDLAETTNVKSLVQITEQGFRSEDALFPPPPMEGTSFIRNRVLEWERCKKVLERLQSCVNTRGGDIFTLGDGSRFLRPPKEKKSVGISSLWVGQ